MTSASEANHNLHPLFSLAYRFRSLKLPRNLIGSLDNLFPAIGQSNYLFFFVISPCQNCTITRTIRKGNQHEPLGVSYIPYSVTTRFAPMRTCALLMHKENSLHFLYGEMSSQETSSTRGRKPKADLFIS